MYKKNINTRHKNVDIADSIFCAAHENSLSF
jgi:hypothetical protein